ncbi:MAG: hypothetical protein J2P31_05620 [Blastocatellia bacterium]|nr:hypothetical protein [Blastocatellia bacterium]
MNDETARDQPELLAIVARRDTTQTRSRCFALQRYGKGFTSAVFTVV